MSSIFERATPARVYTRDHCPLCTRARPILDRLEAEGLFALEWVDIATSPELTARYGTRIPVVELADGRRLEGRISEFRLRRLHQRSIATE